MSYVFDGRRVEVPAGRIAMFWAGISHQTKTIDFGPDAGARQCNVYLPLDVFLHMPHLRELQETMLGGGVICLDPDSIGESDLHRWYGDYRSGNSERSDIVKVELGAMLRRATLVGWDELLAPWIDVNGPSPRIGSPVRYVVAMLRYMLENLSEPLALKDVAGIVGLHPNYALNLFTRVMGISVRAFITRMRLVHARSLLFESDLSIANVAFQSGFTSLSQFYEHFRNAYGITPRVMRQNLVRG
jgi:AraC-like DNA-binding protein